eukprot:gene19411-biopygen6980
MQRIGRRGRTDSFLNQGQATLERRSQWPVWVGPRSKFQAWPLCLCWWSCPRGVPPGLGYAAATTQPTHPPPSGSAAGD